MNKPALESLRVDRSNEPAEGSRRARTVVVLLVLAAVLAAAAYFFWPDPVPQVRTAAAYESGGERSETVLNASGYVTARRQATVSSKITGRVSEVLIEEGMAVEEGQVLARLDDANIRAAYDLAVAQSESARRGLDETEALLEEARLNFQRLQQLERDQLASTSELDRSRALARSLDAQLERKKADVVVAERSVDIYQRQLDDTVIRAPFAGIVVAKNAQPGEMVSPVSAGGGFTRTGIGTIVDMSSLEIEIDVNEAYINRVSPGQDVVATLDAYPDWKIPGHVIAIIPTADRQRATVEVRVGFDELDPRILPDMGVKVAFREPDSVNGSGRAAPGVTIPGAALRKEGARDVVFVTRSGTVERRAVAIGGEAGNSVRIISGLAPGERVVIDPPPGLSDGDSVKERDK
jgi:HlyD family secretion protein